MIISQQLYRRWYPDVRPQHKHAGRQLPLLTINPELSIQMLAI
jgi:hypothetical protein